MDSFLKRYKIKLTTLGPVFVGSGREINKKEYVYDKGLVYVIDPKKLMEAIVIKNLSGKFMGFMQKGTDTLQNWLFNNRLGDYEKLSSYVLKGSENLADKKSLSTIQMFLKDAYNRPYIPGSSLKGLLRTVILWNEVEKAFNSPEIQWIRNEAKNAVNRTDGKSLNKELAKASNKLEEEFFHEQIDKVSVSIMRGLVISDSKPLSLDDLVLCQKIDKDPDGHEEKINVVRECIKPGTTVEFDMTIDSSLFSSVKGGSVYDGKTLRKFISSYANDYYNQVTRYFDQGEYENNAVFLGGGAGYFSKTVSYRLFDENSALDFVKKYLHNTFKTHNHLKDDQISPRMQKWTMYDGKYYEMGKCRIEIIE